MHTGDFTAGNTGNLLDYLLSDEGGAVIGVQRRGGRVSLVVVSGRFSVFVASDLAEAVLLSVISAHLHSMCGDFHMCRCLGGTFVTADPKIGRKFPTPWLSYLQKHPMTGGTMTMSTTMQGLTVLEGGAATV